MRGLITILIWGVLVLPAPAQEFTAGQLADGLRVEVRRLAANLDGKSEYEEFVRRRKLSRLDYVTYLKSKVAYECARDAGLWHIGYRITDREPSSKAIWTQWRGSQGNVLGISAWAECDEVSALYAVVARRLGVKGIGLFWPTSNHTVAVWKLEGQRIVVPTTPIFLDRYDRFDATGFDPATQKTIYDYESRDVEDGFRFSSRLGRFFLKQVADYGGASRDLLHELRYLRESSWRGEPVAETWRQLKVRFSEKAADRRALQRFRQQFIR